MLQELTYKDHIANADSLSSRNFDNGGDVFEQLVKESADFPAERAW